MMQENKHHGPTVEAFLMEEGIYNECLDLAIKADEPPAKTGDSLSAPDMARIKVV